MPERPTPSPATPGWQLASAAMAAAAAFYGRVGELGVRYAIDAVEAAGRGQSVAGGARHFVSELVALPGLAWSRLGEALDPALARTAEPGMSAPVEGRQVVFPLRVLEASQGLAVWAVPIAPAQALLDARHHGELVAADIGHARAALEVYVVDYRVSDLGVYRELGVALYAAPRARPWQVGLSVLDEPVTGHFACRAGVEIWGDPKTEERLDFIQNDASLACKLVRRAGPVLVLTITLPRGGTGSTTDVPLTLYTRVGGRLHASRLVRTGRGERVRAGGAGVTLALHDEQDSLGRALRALRVPGTEPMFHAWTERMSARVSRPVAIG